MEQILSGTIFGLASAASLDRIDTYSLLNIYDHLDFDDLVNVALIDSHYSDLITRHYMIAKYRIHEKLIRISNNPDNATDHPDILSIRNYETILQFLQLFGHLITKLEFSHYYSDSEAPTINRFIAEHCSTSLTEIILKGVGVYLISETKQQFEKVVHVSFSDSNIYADNLKLERIFPRMEYLELNIVRFIRIASIGSLVQTHSHLKHFHYNDRRIDGNDSFLRDFIKLNPQLQTLCLRKLISLDFLQVASENLPKLETLLILNNFPNPFHEKRIHFKSVRNFTFVDRDSSQIFNNFPLSFDSLEIFRVFSELSIDEIGSFIKENRNLSVLLMPWTGLGYDYSIFFDIISEIKELEELRFKWSNNMDQDGVLYLMSEFQKLRKVTFCVHGNECEQLTGMTPQQWQFIQEETQKDCTFQRSTYN